VLSFKIDLRAATTPLGVMRRGESRRAMFECRFVDDHGAPIGQSIAVSDKQFCYIEHKAMNSNRTITDDGPDSNQKRIEHFKKALRNQNLRESWR
jgi:hypothetical protein